MFVKNRLKNKRYVFPVFFVLALVFLLGLEGNTAEGRDDAVAPRVPQFFSVEMKDTEAHLKWQENGEWDMFSYVVAVRSAAEKEAEATKLTGLRYSYSLGQLIPGERYFVSLAARDISGNVSDFTPEIGFIIPKESDSPFSLHGWVPATSDQLDNVVAFEKNRDLFSSISPFEYSLEEDGSISRRGNVFSDETRGRAQAAGVDIIPTITNNFDKNEKGTNVLKDAEKTRKLIDGLISLVEDEGYDGIDIDFENIQADAKDQFTFFVTEISERLHSKNKILSVTLQGKKSDADDWPGVGAQDFTAIGRVTDQVRIMSYDYSRVNTAPGPIAPVGWYEEVLSYAVSKIDAEKVVAGVPTYAYRWCTKATTDECPTDGLVWEGVKNIVEKYEPKVEWNTEYKTPWLTYADEQENEYVVYFENHQSIEAKMNVVSRLGVGGAAIWRLGNEDPENYRVFEKMIGERVVTPHVKIEPRDGEISIDFLDSDTSRNGYRVTYSAKDHTERFVDILGESSYSIPGLVNNTQYTLSVAARKEGDITSDFFDNEPQIVDLGTAAIYTATPKDLAFPGVITDFAITDVDTNSIGVVFNSSGDEYIEGLADHYEIRYAPYVITQENFEDAPLYSSAPRPLPAGERQEWKLQGLEGGTHYFIAIKVFDEAGNASYVSTILDAKTTDVVAPAVPTVSAAIGGDGEIELIWKANQEADLSGYRVYFRTENGAYNIVDLGQKKNHLVIPGVENNRTYELAVSAIDSSRNESDRSEDFVVVPKSGNSLTRFSEEVLLDKEKIQGSLYVFGARIFDKNALPYLSMFAVIIINILIYYSFKGEILRLISRKQSAPVPHQATVRSRRITDMKKR